MATMHAEAKLPAWAVVLAVVLTAAIALLGNQLTAKEPIAANLPGMLCLIGCILAGLVVSKFARRLGIPAIIWVSLLANAGAFLAAAMIAQSVGV